MRRAPDLLLGLLVSVWLHLALLAWLGKGGVAEADVTPGFAEGAGSVVIHFTVPEPVATEPVPSPDETPAAMASPQEPVMPVEPEPVEAMDVPDPMPDEPAPAPAPAVEPVETPVDVGPDPRAPAAPAANANAGVVSAVRAASVIRPRYPLGCRIRGEEGTVRLQVWVTAAGVAQQVRIVESSGYAALDAEAVRAAQGATYRVPDSVRREGAVATTELSIAFRLDGP